MATRAEALVLIDKIYAAALVPGEQGAWRDLLIEAERHFPGGRALLALQDEQSARVDLFEAPHFEPAAIQAYAAHFSAINPWTRDMARLPQGHIHSTEMRAPEAELLRTEFYNDWLKPQDLHSGGGCTVLKDAGRMMIFSFLKPKGVESVTEAEFDLMGELLPHFQRAAQLRRQFAQVELKSGWVTQALDSFSTGMVLLGPSRRVIFMNRAAADLIRGARSLRISPTGELHASRSSDNIQLAKLIEGAERTADRKGLGAGGTVTISGIEDEPAIAVLVAPFSPCVDVPEHRGPYVTIFVAVQGHQSAPKLDLLAALYGLTKAEVQVLCKLVGGMPVHAIASAHRVSVNTVRNQVQKLLEKTGTHRQSDLVARALSDGGSFP